MILQKKWGQLRKTKEKLETTAAGLCRAQKEKARAEQNGVTFGQTVRCGAARTVADHGCLDETVFNSLSRRQIKQGIALAN